MSLFDWWRDGDQRARRAFFAASCGWMLDAFDVMLFSLVLASMMADLDLTTAEGGALNSVTLVAAAFVAGIVSGVENAPPAGRRGKGVRTRQVPEDDVPQEYLDED